MIDDVLGLVGTTIADKYAVERVVGEGGFAVVYRAQHTLWKRPVALKVFRALADLPAAAREELTQNFIREGALLAELSEKSASICQARDVAVLTTATGVSVPYMVLEWLEGESLDDALVREYAAGEPPRSLVDTIRLLEPVAEALSLAHARGIAHRDVKPANIFLLGGARDERCPVKLLDFGIAKVVQDIQKTGGAFTKTSGTLTSFTPAYAAPEQFSRARGSTGPWTDVFALALVAVELLTGRPPLEGDNFMQLGFAAADPAVRPSPRSRGAIVPDRVEEVFLRALAVEPNDRYRAADAFWHDLRAAAGLGPTSSFDAGVASVTSGPQFTAVRAAQVDALGTTQSLDQIASSASTTMPLIADAQRPPASSSRAKWFAIAGVPVAALGVFLAYASITHTKPVDGATTASASTPVVSGAASSPTAPPSSATPTPGAPAKGAQCPDDMAYIPGGSFFMGSDDGFAFEKPAHKVRLAPYCMDIHEVTTARYAACSDQGWCKRAAKDTAGEGLSDGERPAYDALCNENDRTGRAEHPINCVTWEMADVFCRSMKVRLPTEAEWEYAARGSDGRMYPWGDAVPSALHLNACGTECAAWTFSTKVSPIKPMYDADDHWAATAPVGSFPQGQSKFGVLDLAGNVWEWVRDWYGPYSAGDGVDGVKAPDGPAKGTRKVIRGGAWNGSDPSWERPSFRYAKEPADRHPAVGFRCAAEPL